MNIDIPTNGPTSDGILQRFNQLMELSVGLNHIEPVTDISIIDELKKALIDPNIEPKEGAMIVSIGTASFATLGNFSCLLGQAKSKKTFFITLLIAALLKGSVDIIQAYKAIGKTRIVWFDTEQSRTHVYKAYKRALKLSCEASFYSIEVYELRPYSPGERIELISHVLRDQNPNNEIAFVVIDGIRDLVTDINNPVQATDTATWLLKLTGDKNLHICTVIHQNKGDKNARGHLGTEMVNKAESVLSVNKDSENISSVKAEFCRDRNPEPFAFTIDEISSLPQILQGYSGSEFREDGARGRVTHVIQDEKHRQVMEKVFGFQSAYSYSELIIQAKVQYREAGFTMGDNKVKELVRHCDNIKIIRKDGNQGTKAKYILNK